MVNSQVVKETSNALKIDERVQTIPTASPVIDVGIKHSKIDVIKTGYATDTTSNTLWTTPTTQDFYLKAFIISHLRDAANNGTTYGFSFVKNGETITLNFPVRGLLALTNPAIITYTLDSPILLDRGTQINILNAANTSLVKTNLTIFGFIDEVN